MRNHIKNVLALLAFIVLLGACNEESFVKVDSDKQDLNRVSGNLNTFADTLEQIGVLHNIYQDSLIHYFENIKNGIVIATKEQNFKITVNGIVYSLVENGEFKNYINPNMKNLDLENLETLDECINSYKKVLSPEIIDLLIALSKALDLYIIEDNYNTLVHTCDSIIYVSDGLRNSINLPYEAVISGSAASVCKHSAKYWKENSSRIDLLCDYNEQLSGKSDMLMALSQKEKNMISSDIGGAVGGAISGGKWGAAAGGAAGAVACAVSGALINGACKSLVRGLVDRYIKLPWYLEWAV